MRHSRRYHCLLPGAKRRVQPGCAAEVESMVGLERCDFFAMRDLVEFTKVYEQDSGFQQQSFVNEKVCALKMCATFLASNAYRGRP